MEPTGATTTAASARTADDTSPVRPSAAVGKGGAAAKRPCPEGGMASLYLHDLKANVEAAAASKKVDMRPSPVWGRSKDAAAPAEDEAFGNTASTDEEPPATALASACMPTPIAASLLSSSSAASVVSASSSSSTSNSTAAEFLAGGADVVGGKKKRPSKREAKAKADGADVGARRWTKEEDQKLRDAVQALGAANWKIIATDYLGGARSDVQCLHRWNKVLQPGLVKGPWTDEEDAVIVECIAKGVTKWSEIADRIPGRLGKQCRDRWVNHLDPGVKKGEWTEEEDAILVAAQAKYGNAWTKIARLLPGRSENTVKNRWNSASRRRAKAAERAAAVAAPLPLPPPPGEAEADGKGKGKGGQGNGKKPQTVVEEAAVDVPPAVDEPREQAQPSMAAAALASVVPAPPMTAAMAATSALPQVVPPPVHTAAAAAAVAAPPSTGLYDPCWDFQAPGFAGLEPFPHVDFALHNPLLNLYNLQPHTTHIPPPASLSRVPTPAPPMGAAPHAMPTPSALPTGAATAHNNPRRQSREFLALAAALEQQQQQHTQEHTQEHASAAAAAAAAAAPLSFLTSYHHQAAAAVQQQQHQPQYHQQHHVVPISTHKPPSRPGSAGGAALLGTGAVPPALSQPALYAAPEMEFLHSPTGAGALPADPTSHLLAYHLGEEPHSEFLV